MSDFLNRIAKLSPQRLALLANQLNERLQALESERSAPVAIIGMGCRFPGRADDPESFWTLLHNGVDAISEVPADRWDVDELYHPDPEMPGRMATRWGGFIEAPDCFDPKFFGIAPGEAITLDPQQRLLLETAWEALENGGINPASLLGTATGVFVGLCNSDYAFRAMRASREKITPYFGSGLSHSVASGRISYLLGLQGPSVTIDTSCSASLVAIHLACQSLRRRESDLVLAGGANIILNPEITIALSRSRMMAPDGRCKPFSDDANGFVRAEGSGVVVLKRLSDALVDRNRILAVIRGTAANQDGKSNGLTAPNGPSQEAVLRAALADAGVAAEDIQYIEAHGTGTSLGDPIEVGALARVFAERSSESGPLWIGSVKSNVGHLESAAGIAGLMKLVLALQHGEIPATLHLDKLNRRIEWDALPIRPARHNETWPVDKGTRTGGVSSFGFSGTNVHVVVQEAAAETVENDTSEGLPRLVMLSAKTDTALRKSAERLERWLQAHPALRLPAVAHTLSSGRCHFENRIAFIVRSCDDTIQKLRSFPDGDLLMGRVVEHKPRIGFVFSSDGTPVDSWQALVENVPIFREKFNQCDAIFSGEMGGAGILEGLRRSMPSAIPADISSVLSLTLQYAYAELLQSCGVAPAYIVGSESGALAASCCAGVLRIEDALRLAIAAGRKDERTVESLSGTTPMESSLCPWYAAEGRGALAPFLQRALTLGVALPELQQPVEKNRVSILIGNSESGVAANRTVAIYCKGEDGLEGFVRATAELFVAGCSPDLSRLYGPTVPRTVALPTYPFERERYWLETEPELPSRHSTSSTASAGPVESEASVAPSDWLYQVAWEPQPIRVQTTEQKSLSSVMEAYSAEPASEAALRLGEAASRLQSVCAFYALRSLHELGLRKLTGETFDLNELCERLQIAPARSRIAGRILGILAEDGFIAREHDRFRVLENREVPDPDLELAKLAEQYPEIETELKILKRCADQTPAVLRGTCDPMQLVFAKGAIDEAEQIYEKSPICRHFNRAASEMIRRAVAGIQGRTARILEIGAGTGATTSSVLPPLVGQDVAYTFTDLSPVFLAKAREKFRSFSGMDYKLLNMERDPKSQGFDANSFDIILAANVLHATARLEETVAHAHQLLRPGGLLMLIEGTHPDRWLDLTFGLTDGWWRFADSDLRKEHPLISAEKWETLFRKQGLNRTRAITYTEHNGKPSQQVLLAACADSLESGATREESRRQWLILGDHSGVGAALKEILRIRPDAGKLIELDADTVDSAMALASDEKVAADGDLQVVYLGSLNASNPTDGVDFCAKVPVRLIQRFSSSNRKTKLWLVTRGAQAAHGSMPTAKSALQAITWGIARVMGLELPDLFARVIDLDPDCTPEDSANELFSELMQRDIEDQIVLRRGERLAPRLRHMPAGELGQTVARPRRDGSYLVTGAFGTVGRHVTRWLAQSGAGHLVLLSRTGAGDRGDAIGKERAQFLKELQGLGTSVKLIRTDLSSSKTIDEVFRCFGADFPPLRGVFHMATSQKMSELSSLSEEELDEVLRPKVLGGWLLAHAARRHELDCFVSFSSITALLGAQRSAAYAAGNQFLDSLAWAERSQGHPMTSVNWGAWTIPGANEQLQRVGLVPMATERALAWLPQILGSSRPQFMIADIDWKTAKGLYESRRLRPILSELKIEGTDRKPIDLKQAEKVTAKPEGASIAEMVLKECSRVLGFRAGDRPPADVPLTELGLDSLMAVDLRNGLQNIVGRELSPTIVFDYPTLSELTELMETMVWAGAGDSSFRESSPQDEVHI